MESKTYVYYQIYKGRNASETYYLFAAKTFPNGGYIRFEYPWMGEDEYKQLIQGKHERLKPSYMILCDKEFCAAEKHLINKTLDELNMSADFLATYQKPEFEEKIIGDISDEEMTAVQSKKHPVRVFLGYSFDSGIKAHYYHIPYQKEETASIFGDQSINYARSWNLFNIGADEIFIDRVKDGINKSQTSNSRNYLSTISEKITVFTKNTDGLSAKTIQRTVKSKGNKIILEYKVIYSFDFSLNGFACYKHYVNKEPQKCESPFKEIGINSQNYGLFSRNIYSGYESFIDFAMDNEDLLRKLGFASILAAKKSYSPENTFIIFLALLSEYPILEQLIKMGHINMYSCIHDSIVAGENKEQIRKKVSDINVFINTETSKGKDALRFPKYIGDHLISQRAPMSEYYVWMDIYEITKISKENFEAYVNSFPYLLLHSEIGRYDPDKVSVFEKIPNLLKFGYGLEKVTKYLIKQAKKSEQDAKFLIEEFIDYLNMCDMMGVKPDYYPQNIVKVHDDMARAFRAKQNEIKDQQLKKIAFDCKEVSVPKDISAVGVPQGFSDYTIVFPESVNDFIDEGNQQHNCVGGYYARVIDGKSIVFFIRDKETPGKSFVTAECTTRGLSQCYYSNNRRVTNEKIMMVAKYVCRKILSGVKTHKIDVLKERSR